MIYSSHARRRMELRGIPVADVEAIVLRPTKVAPGENGATNYWGYGPRCRYRVRVTVFPGGVVGTVTWADRRKVEK